MDKKTLISAALIAAVVAGGMVWALFPQSQPVQVVKQTLGALSGPDINSSYLRWGGVAEFSQSADTTATSSVVCAIQSPAATSTLLGATFAASANGLGAQNMYISTSSTAVGSSTVSLSGLVAIPSAAGVEASIGPASFFSTAGPGILFPTTYLTYRIATTTPGVFASYVTGSCKARFQTLLP